MRLHEIPAYPLQFITTTGSEHDFATGEIEDVSQRFAESRIGTCYHDHLGMVWVLENCYLINEIQIQGLAQGIPFLEETVFAVSIEGTAGPSTEC